MPTEGRLRSFGIGVASSCCLVFLSLEAAAYSTRTAVSDPCHEDITQEALSRARRTLGPIDRISPTRNERALIDDVPFVLRNDLDDLGGATLVIGNRNVDFRGHEQDDLDVLAPLHGRPGNQDEHCLRSPAHDGAEGSKDALEACRRLIRRRVSAALDGLAEDGTVDADIREEVDIALDIRGSVEARLPTYHMEMGRALHTIQDGFSHTYRTEDHLQVVTVLNYAEMVEDTHDLDEDGPVHRSPLDDCVDLDAFRAERLEVAIRAGEEFLVATLDPLIGRAEKMERVDALLDEYFTHVDGCDVTNDWCDAPEEKYENSTLGCSVAAAGSRSWLGMGVGVGVLLAGLWQRRRALRQRRAMSLPWFTAMGLGLGVLAVVGPVEAQQERRSRSAAPSSRGTGTSRWARIRGSRGRARFLGFGVEPVRFHPETRCRWCPRGALPSRRALALRRGCRVQSLVRQERGEDAQRCGVSVRHPGGALPDAIRAGELTFYLSGWCVEDDVRFVWRSRRYHWPVSGFQSSGVRL